MGCENDTIKVEESGYMVDSTSVRETEVERRERIRQAVNRRLKAIGEPHTIGQFLWHFDIDKSATVRANLNLK